MKTPPTYEIQVWAVEGWKKVSMPPEWRTFKTMDEVMVIAAFLRLTGWNSFCMYKNSKLIYKSIRLLPPSPGAIAP